MPIKKPNPTPQLGPVPTQPYPKPGEPYNPVIHKRPTYAQLREHLEQMRQARAPELDRMRRAEVKVAEYACQIRWQQTRINALEIEVKRLLGMRKRKPARKAKPSKRHK